jgi:hypothetical protein
MQSFRDPHRLFLDGDQTALPAPQQPLTRFDLAAGVVPKTHGNILKHVAVRRFR